MTNHYGCPILLKLGVNAGSSGVHLGLDSQVTSVYKRQLEPCLNCHQPMCYYELIDKRKQERINAGYYRR